MDCRTICRELPDLIDGDLRPHRAQEIQGHLESCAECKTTYDDYVLLRQRSREALAYPGTPLSFSALEPRMAAIEPLDQILCYQLPKLKIPGAVPRFAVAMMLLVALAGVSYAFRHTRQVYVGVQTPFALQKDTLTAALDEGRFPGDVPRDAPATREDDRWT